MEPIECRIERLERERDSCLQTAEWYEYNRNFRLVDFYLNNAVNYDQQLEAAQARLQAGFAF